MFIFHKERCCLNFWYGVSMIKIRWKSIRNEVVSSIIIMKTSIIFKNFDNFRTFIMISNITSSWEHKCRNQKRTWYIAFGTSYLSVYEVKLHLICMVRVWCMIIVLKYKTKSWNSIFFHVIFLILLDILILLSLFYMKWVVITISTNSWYL